MFGIETKKLTEAQLHKAEQLGEKVGNVFFKKGFVSEKINRYVSKHRLVVLPVVVLFAFTVTVVGLFWPQQEYVTNPIPSAKTSSPQEDKTVMGAYEQVLSEYQVRMDSVQRLLSRENLTFEDSIYIATSLEYINQLQK